MLRDWTDSEKVNTISVHAERFFTRLIMKVDDYGIFPAHISLLKASLFPLLLNGVREADISRWMAECQKAGMIVFYEAESKKYLQIVNFKQRLDKARSRYPFPPLIVSVPVVNEIPEFVNEFRDETETEIEKEKELGGEPPAPSDLGAKLKSREDLFYKQLIPYLHTYGKKMIREFFDYWRESNKSKTKMRLEKEETWDLSLRLIRWAGREKVDPKNKKYDITSTTDAEKQRMAKRAAEISATD